MAMTMLSLKNRLKVSLAAKIGTPENEDKRNAFAEAIAQAVYDEITQNADIVLSADDIETPATGLLDSTASPCTGTAKSSAVTLSTRIK